MNLYYEFNFLIAKKYIFVFLRDRDIQIERELLSSGLLFKCPQGLRLGEAVNQELNPSLRHG